MSIGVAAFPESGNDPQMVLKAADEALYRAKAGGRNRVEPFVRLADSEGSIEPCVVMTSAQPRRLATPLVDDELLPTSSN